jgi:hypothetical protein
MENKCATYQRGRVNFIVEKHNKNNWLGNLDSNQD